MIEEDDEHALLCRYADYCRKAEDAERLAGAAQDASARRSFEMVAFGWRQLAEQVKRSLSRLTGRK